MRPRSILIATAFAIIVARSLFAAGTGKIKLDVMGDLSKGASNRAQVISAGGESAGEVAPGAEIALAPGEYKVVLPIIGGKITKDNIKVEPGRTTTVMITNVAVLRVSAKDRNGVDPGLPVIVTDAEPPHQKIATMVSGDSLLMAPNKVDVKVDAPPQGYFFHGVELRPNNRSELTLDEVVQAELTVQPILSGVAMDNSTRVVVYKAGTQNQVAASAPAPEHRFKLDPGDYDVYLENNSGKGAPTAMDRGIHLDSGAKVERKVSLGG
jgi:hypothetical protein